MQVDIPVITRQAETKQDQEKGGLEMTVAPVGYQPATHTKTTVAQAQETVGGELMGGHQGKVYVTIDTQTTAQVKPDRLSFLVTINNKMPRVFHGAGTVVQFNVGGRVLAVDQRGYSTLQGAIVPPQQQQQVTIVGPPLSELPAKSGIIGVFLYDVVTQQSDAGVVTEKQNYTWYFDYTMTPQPIEVAAPQNRAGYMPIQEYQRIMAQQQMEQMRGQPYAPSQVPPVPAGYPAVGQQ
ncbi:MAG TPA: hypothetical protein VH370_12680 [Humisphaera sp.]|nr:hypothetical protein [Humisphaera sp.]